MLRVFTGIVLLAFLILTLIFAIQNLKVVDVQFLTWTWPMPAAVLIVGAYVLGMISGSALFTFFWRSVKRLHREQAHA